MRVIPEHLELNLPRMWSNNILPHDGHDARGALLRLLTLRGLGEVNQQCGTRFLSLDRFMHV